MGLFLVLGFIRVCALVILVDISLLCGSGRSPGGGNDSSILAQEIPWTEETGGLQSVGHKGSDTTE